MLRCGGDFYSSICSGLKIFRLPQDPRPIRVLSLTEMTRVTPSDKTTKKNCFQIETAERTFYCCCETQARGAFLAAVLGRSLPRLFFLSFFLSVFAYCRLKLRNGCRLLQKPRLPLRRHSRARRRQKTMRETIWIPAPPARTTTRQTHSKSTASIRKTL